MFKQHCFTCTLIFGYLYIYQLEENGKWLYVADRADYHGFIFWKIQLECISVACSEGDHEVEFQLIKCERDLLCSSLFLVTLFSNFEDGRAPRGEDSEVFELSLAACQAAMPILDSSELEINYRLSIPYPKYLGLASFQIFSRFWDICIYIMRYLSDRTQV